MRVKIKEENGYTFKEYQGNFQNVKYDTKKNDYYLTFGKRRFYFNDASKSCYMDEYEKDKPIIGVIMEGYSSYLIVADGDISLTERAKIVFCPPGI